MTNKIQVIYLIESGGLYKIGISSDINARIRTLQTANGNDVRCIAYYSTIESAKCVESKLHKLFTKYRQRGEWFDFQGKFTLELFETVCDRFGMSRLDFEDDGSCTVLYEEVVSKPKRRFGDIPEYTIPEYTSNIKEQSYWRKRYGIKSK